MKLLASLRAAAIGALPVLAALAPTPAPAATTYFAGTEDIDFTTTGSVSWNATSTLFRSGWTRIGSVILGVAADPPTNRLTTPTFTAASTLWVHGQFFEATSNATTANTQLFRLLDGGTARLLVRGTGTAGQVKISTRNAAGTITDLVTSSSGAWAGATITSFDLFINYAVSGRVTLYIGGTQVADFSGDVTTNSATTLNQLEVGGCSTANGVSWTEVIVSDGDTRGKGLWLMNTSSAGNADQWAGTLSNVNKNTINDATFISSGTNNQIQEYLVGTAPAGAYAVDAVVMSARALRGSLGPQHFGFVTRVGGTDYTSSDRAPTLSFSNFNNYIQATNPDTSAVWTLPDLTAASVNYGVKSTP